jgi:hypothetical protein
MTFPLEIHFRDMEPSESVERQVREWAAKLHGGHIESCAVTLSQPHHHHRQGRRFHVRITLALPGRTLVVSEDPGEAGAHEDAHVTIRDAFLAARRQLEAVS